MRKLLRILVVFVFSAQLGGYYCYFFIHNAILHWKKFERLEGSQSQTLHLSTRDYLSMKTSDDEIEINGKWFDIQATHYRNSGVTLTVIRDFEEEVLMDFLTNAFDDDNTDPLPSLLSQMFQITFLKSFPTFDFTRTAQEFFITSLSVIYFSTSKACSEPPPWC